MNTQSHIDQFFRYWTRQAKVIAETTFVENAEVYRKTLFCCIIDAIATVAARGAKLSHRLKFTQAVRDYGNWPDHSKVSTPHVIALLELTDDPSFKKAREYVANLPRDNTSVVSITKDPEFAVLEQVWPVGNRGSRQLMKIEGVQLDYLRHDNLLYSLRNTLVHEARTHGTSLPLEWQKVPYYHKVVNLDTGDRSWSLNYPSAFLITLTENIIVAVEQGCRADNVDPYSFFHFGDFWLQRLNEP